MRSGSCIERIAVSSLQTLYQEGLLKIMWDWDLVSRGSSLQTIRLTLNQRITPNNMRPGSRIERITVSTLQTLYREGLLSSEKSTLASLINICYANACMNARRLWISDCLNVCMYECMKTFNFWLFECVHVWMHENFEFLIVWMCQNFDLIDFFLFFFSSPLLSP